MLKKIWDHLEEYTIIVSLMVTVGVVFFQIVMRYVFQASLSWSEELARYIFLWQIWLGASYAVKERRHLKIEFVIDLLPKDKRFYMNLLSLVLWCTFSFFLAIKGSELTRMLITRGQVSPAMQIPMAFGYASVPVGCGLMFIRLMGQIIALIKARKEGVA